MSLPRFLADENLHERLVLALVRRVPDIDFVRVRDLGMAGQADPEILEWAARGGRIVVSHDLGTMPQAAYARVIEGKPMPGLFVVAFHAPPREVIEDLALIAGAGTMEEWRDQVTYLPISR